jgi:hypothetical protein
LANPNLDQGFHFLLHERQVLQWNPLEWVAAFITPKDDLVATHVARYLHDVPLPIESGENRAGEAWRGREPNRLKTARLLFDRGLRDYGLRYRPDPLNPMGRVMGAGRYEYTDTITYPRELLQASRDDRWEDCNGLTTLYASLLMNQGIDIVLLATPDHVFLMFDSNLPATRANRERLVWAKPWAPPGAPKAKERLWIPVEMTVLAEDVLRRLSRPSAFAAAMEIGSRNYDRYKRQGILSHLPVRRAWQAGFLPPPLPASRRR